MDNDRIKGKMDEMTGKAKQKLGDLTNDGETKAEGMGQEVKGKVQNAFGKVKDEFRAGKEESREKEIEREENRRDDVA